MKSFYRPTRLTPQELEMYSSRPFPLLLPPLMFARLVHTHQYIECRLVIHVRAVPELSLLERQQDRLHQYQTRLKLWSQRALEREQRRLSEFKLRLQALDPNQPLKRGYALITDAQGHLVDSITKAPPTSQVQLRLADGQLQARIESVLPDA